MPACTLCCTTRDAHLHAVLRRLGLLLPDDADDGHQAHVHHAHVVGADAELELRRAGTPSVMEPRAVGVPSP